MSSHLNDGRAICRPPLPTMWRLLPRLNSHRHVASVGEVHREVSPGFARQSFPLFTGCVVSLSVPPNRSW